MNFIQPKILNMIKVLFTLIIFGFILYKLIYSYHIDKLVDEFTFDYSFQNILLLIFVFIFSVFNWSLESVKWKLLVSKNENITFYRSLKAVLSGVTLSIITPNQLGDFAGRVLHLKKNNKINGVLVTLVGHTAQVIMTCIFGLFAGAIFFYRQNKFSQNIFLLLILIICVLVIGAIYLFINLKFLQKIKIHNRIDPYLEVISNYSKKELIQIVAISFLRYLIFISQYYFLLRFYHINISVTNSFIGIYLTFFVQSFVPSFLLIELGMRGASALWFFGFYTHQVTEILLSAYSLWVINLMIPGIVGLYFILKLRMNKQ